ncbi:MAG: hypothetical protein ACRDYX_13340 [Egibacteraceae bacterium]
MARRAGGADSARAAFYASVTIAATVLLMAVPARSESAPVKTQTWFVAPNLSPSGSGVDTGSPATIQAALDRAQPGDVIQLQPGVYKHTKALQTKRDGEASRPITIKGPETGLDVSQRNKAVVVGGGHVFNIDHSHYVLDGFTINGQPHLPFTEIPTAPRELLAYKDSNQPRVADSRLVYVGNKARDVTGTVITNMFLTGAGGECVRMRNFTTNSKVTNSLIYRCGFVAKSKDYRYHNGEGVYIGTSAASTDQPYHKNDGSNNNLVQNNVIQTFASECVNIKEHASGNVVDSNQCLYGLGPEAANEALLEVRGRNNQITNNTIKHSWGYGIKLWSDTPSSGGANIVAGNHLSDIRSAVITVKTQSQPAEICQNIYADGIPAVVGRTGAAIAKTCSRTYPDWPSRPTSPAAGEPAPLNGRVQRLQPRPRRRRPRIGGQGTSSSTRGAGGAPAERQRCRV